MLDRSLKARLDSELSAGDWREILIAWDNRCAYCGVQLGDKLVVEHVEPRSRGGADERANIVPACRRCNSQKCSMFLLEWIASKQGPCVRVIQRNKDRVDGIQTVFIRLRPEFRHECP